MSKAKISPWPWKIYPTHNKIEIQDANAQQVAVVWSGEMRHGGHSKSRYMNARLLALAPKLLEECGNALRVLRRINNPDVGCTCHTDGHYCAACTTRDLETIVACASEVPDVFTVDPWCHKETHDDRAIDPAQGYTLTPAANPVVCSKCRTFGCDHHTLDAAKPEAKPADVPEVSELWGRIHIGSGKIRVYASKAFAIKAQAGCRDEQWVVMDQPLQRPADKPAARVVKVPTFAASRRFSVPEQIVIDELNKKWRTALAAVGVEYKEATPESEVKRG